MRVIFMVFMVTFMVPDPRSIFLRRARMGARSAGNPPRGTRGPWFFLILSHDAFRET